MKNRDTYFAGVTHQSLCDGVDRVEDHKLGDACGACCLPIREICRNRTAGRSIPDPSNRAVPDSLLYSLPAEPKAGAIAAGDMLEDWSHRYTAAVRGWGQIESSRV